MAFNAADLPIVKFCIWHHGDRDDPCGIIPMDVVDIIGREYSFKILERDLRRTGHIVEYVYESSEPEFMEIAYNLISDSARVYSQMVALGEPALARFN